MNIVQNKKDELSAEYTVTMTAEEIASLIDERLQEIGKTVKMPGFRPGKVPMSMLKTKYGKAVMGEVLEKAVNDSSMQAINENNLRPAMRPKIEVKTFDEKEGLEYTMALELLPEIKLADLKTIKLEKLVAKPEDAQVQETLERIASSNKTSKEVEEKRAAKKGDIVVIDFDGTVDGEAMPGMKAEGHHLELGSNSFIDNFEDQLVGMKSGDEKTIKVTFPKDYGAEHLQGKEAEFKVVVKELREPVEAKIDDDFAKNLGFEEVSKLKEAVAEQMQNEYDQLTRLTIKRALLDKLNEAHDFKVPAGMVEAEFEGIWKQVKGYDHDHEHGEHCNHDHDVSEDEGDKEEFRDIALRRVKLGLVLAEIGRLNNIEVTNQELQQAVINEARRYPGQEKQVFEYYQSNPQALESLKAPVYEEKVVDFILESATLSERQVTIDELTKASEEAEPMAKKAASKDKKGKKETKKTGKK